MRTLILALVVACACVAMSGCFTFDEEHNRAFIKTVRTDVRLMHQDLDFILLWDEESPLDSYYR